jgi:ABC-type multidrug transport system permease subunit
VTSYLFAKFITEIPFNVTPPFLFAIISYWIIGLNPLAERFVNFFLIVMYYALTAITLGMAVGAIVPNVDAATALGTPCMIIAILFGGYYMYVFIINSIK